MNAELIPLLWLGAAFLGLFGLAELLYHQFRISAEHTRSIVHAGTGQLTLLFPLQLQHLWQVALLCGAFLIILLASRRFRFLPSINAVQRKSNGSLLYPVIVVIAFAFYQRMQTVSQPLFKPLYYFYVPLLLLAICDPVAALAGRSFRKRFPDTAPGKTFAGSFAFLILASAICVSLSLLFTTGEIPGHYFVATGIATAYAATLAERFSNGGWDNFTIPAAAMICIAAADYAL